MRIVAAFSTAICVAVGSVNRMVMLANRSANRGPIASVASICFGASSTIAINRL